MKHGIQHTETYRNSPSVVQSIMDELQERATAVRLRVIRCTCPPNYKYCECGDKLGNRKKVNHGKT